MKINPALFKTIVEELNKSIYSLIKVRDTTQEVLNQIEEESNECESYVISCVHHANKSKQLLHEDKGGKLYFHAEYWNPGQILFFSSKKYARELIASPAWLPFAEDDVVPTIEDGSPYLIGKKREE